MIVLTISTRSLTRYNSVWFIVKMGNCHYDSILFERKQKSKISESGPKQYTQTSHCNGSALTHFHNDGENHLSQKYPWKKYVHHLGFKLLGTNSIFFTEMYSVRSKDAPTCLKLNWIKRTFPVIINQINRFSQLLIIFY